MRKHHTLLTRTLRQRSTPAEGRLWKHLRSRQFGHLKFRRQHPIGQYVVDFYCAAKKLVVEVDGDVHALSEQEEYDRERTYFLKNLGIMVIRFTNSDVMNNMNGIGDRLLEILCSSPQPSPQRGEGGIVQP